MERPEAREFFMDCVQDLNEYLHDTLSLNEEEDVVHTTNLYENMALVLTAGNRVNLMLQFETWCPDLIPDAAERIYAQVIQIAYSMPLLYVRKKEGLIIWIDLIENPTLLRTGYNTFRNIVEMIKIMPLRTKQIEVMPVLVLGISSAFAFAFASFFSSVALALMGSFLYCLTLIPVVPYVRQKLRVRKCRKTKTHPKCKNCRGGRRGY